MINITDILAGVALFVMLAAFLTIGG